MSANGKYIFLSILAVSAGAVLCYAIKNRYSCKASNTGYGDYELIPS